MDKKQLITIAITAIIGALSRELIGWILSLIKHPLLRQALKERAQRAFTKKVRSALADIIVIGGVILNVTVFLRKSGPPARSEVIIIAVSTAFATLYIVLQIFHWVLASVERVLGLRGPKEELPEAHDDESPRQDSAESASI